MDAIIEQQKFCDREFTAQEVIDDPGSRADLQGA